MKISAPTITGNDEFVRKQPVKLGRNIYGGLFQRYTAPKDYKMFSSSDMEEKFFVSFLITHDAGARELPRFTEAFCGVRTKRFYDPVSKLGSTMVWLYAALLAGKMTPEQIATVPSDELPDLDDLIGYPAMLYVKPATKADKNGIIANSIDTQAGGFQAPDQAFRRAAAAIFKSADMRVDSRGLRYLAKPETQFEDGTTSAAVSSDDDIKTDDIPF